MRTHLFVMWAICLGLSGCAGLVPAKDDVKTEFSFDYQVSSKSKNELWKSARDYFAIAYGDSRSVFRVMDPEDGTIIGKGVSSWRLMTNNCLTGYHIRFAAKDNKARLQFEIIRGVPPLSQCAGWPWPTEDGYQEIVNNFRLTSDGLKNALESKGDSTKLKDF